MKKRFISALLAALLPMAAAAEKPRAMFGVVADAAALQQGGVLVLAVRPESPAHQAGVVPGDVLLSLNGAAVNSREDVSAALRPLTPGQAVEVELLRQGKSCRFRVVLAECPVRPRRGPASAGAAVGGDRMLRPLVVNPSIRKAMAEQRRETLRQLAALPAGFEPSAVTERLQAIRHLARDANPRGRGWMLGEAGEVSLQFRDAAGVLVLHGANSQLTLSVYDGSGALVQKLPLNTPEERAAVPEPVIERLRRLR